MTPPLPPARQYPPEPRSFLFGPDGPAGAPTEHRLRSSALIGLRENREQKQDPSYKVSTVRGEPQPFGCSAARWQAAGSRGVAGAPVIGELVPRRDSVLIIR
jgi:hypothetical protein